MTRVELRWDLGDAGGDVGASPRSTITLLANDTAGRSVCGREKKKISVCVLGPVYTDKRT